MYLTANGKLRDKAAQQLDAPWFVYGYDFQALSCEDGAFVSGRQDHDLPIPQRRIKYSTTWLQWMVLIPRPSSFEYASRPILKEFTKSLRPYSEAVTLNQQISFWMPLYWTQCQPSGRANGWPSTGVPDLAHACMHDLLDGQWPDCLLLHDVCLTLGRLRFHVIGVLTATLRAALYERFQQAYVPTRLRVYASVSI